MNSLNQSLESDNPMPEAKDNQIITLQLFNHGGNG